MCLGFLRPQWVMFWLPAYMYLGGALRVLATGDPKPLIGLSQVYTESVYSPQTNIELERGELQRLLCLWKRVMWFWEASL